MTLKPFSETITTGSEIPTSPVLHAEIKNTRKKLKPFSETISTEAESQYQKFVDSPEWRKLKKQIEEWKKSGGTLHAKLSGSKTKIESKAPASAPDKTGTELTGDLEEKLNRIQVKFGHKYPGGPSEFAKCLTAAFNQGRDLELVWDILKRYEKRGFKALDSSEDSKEWEIIDEAFPELNPGEHEDFKDYLMSTPGWNLDYIQYYLKKFNKKSLKDIGPWQWSLIEKALPHIGPKDYAEKKDIRTETAKDLPSDLRGLTRKLFLEAAIREIKSKKHQPFPPAKRPAPLKKEEIAELKKDLGRYPKRSDRWSQIDYQIKHPGRYFPISPYGEKNISPFSEGISTGLIEDVSSYGVNEDIQEVKDVAKSLGLPVPGLGKEFNKGIQAALSAGWKSDELSSALAQLVDGWKRGIPQGTWGLLAKEKKMIQDHFPHLLTEKAASHLKRTEADWEKEGWVKLPSGKWKSPTHDPGKEMMKKLDELIKKDGKGHLKGLGWGILRRAGRWVCGKVTPKVERQRDWLPTNKAEAETVKADYILAMKKFNVSEREVHNAIGAWSAGDTLTGKASDIKNLVFPAVGMTSDLPDGFIAIHLTETIGQPLKYSEPNTSIPRGDNYHPSVGWY